MSKLFSSFDLKILAILTMTIDHIGSIFFPDMIFFRIIGRLSFPLFAWMIAVGYIYTKDFPVYLLRLSILAVIAQIPFALLMGGINVVATLTAGLLAIWAYDKLNSKILKTISILALGFVATYFGFSYEFFGVFLVLSFYAFRNDFYKLLISQLVLYGFYVILLLSLNPSNPAMTLIVALGLLALPFIYLWNTKQGPKLKYLFYIFYPGHLLLLYFIKLFLNYG